MVSKGTSLSLAIVYLIVDIGWNWVGLLLPDDHRGTELLMIFVSSSSGADAYCFNYLYQKCASCLSCCFAYNSLYVFFLILSFLMFSSNSTFKLPIFSSFLLYSLYISTKSFCKFDKPGNISPCFLCGWICQIP